jgi:DNA gyrase/topoisomerase IV subunit B
MSESNKEIVSLSDHEHVLLRPTMYVGSVDISEEETPVIREGKVVYETRLISVAFYKMFNEILDNAIDEAKRMNGKMKSITVDIDSKINRVSIEDTGGGFYKGTDLNKKTGVTNIETAMSQLRAGSNFKNDNTAETLIGTNGVGAALVNMLSSKFVVETKNKETSFYKEWENFAPKPNVIKKGKQTETGTKISYVPRKDIFKKAKWDKDIIHAMMVFKNYLIRNDDTISKLKFSVTFDGEALDLNTKFFPEKHWSVKTPIGILTIYESFLVDGSKSGSVSFMNSAMCTGIHQRIINEKINEELQDTLGHHFYETFLVLNLPPKIVRFKDQNKTKYDGTRDEVEGTLLHNFQPKLKQFFATPIFDAIRKKVEERKMDTEIKKLRNLKKKVNVKHSAKYFPPSGRIENLFIVEGESAMGSILQKRNTKNDGVYSLKGKIKNVRSVTDLSQNKEIIELMQILDLDTDPSKRTFTYKRVIIATDADEDGAHIFSLLVNFFCRWFPYVIDEGRLFTLKIPLMSIEEGKKREYLYDKKEFDEHVKKHKATTGLRFLKGLGSLDIKDWESVMANKKLIQVKQGVDARRYIDMAFGTDSAPRKKWLSSDF